MIKALIVIDMQNDFIDGSLGTDEAQAIVDKVVEKIRACNKEDYICYTTDCHDKYDIGIEQQLIPKHCMVGSKGFELNDKVYRALREKHATWINKDTFANSELIGFISDLFDPTDGRHQKINEIEIVGLCTDICVISNALMLRSAFPNTRIVVDASCCAGTTPSNHKAALDVMRACCIEIVNKQAETDRIMIRNSKMEKEKKHDL